MKTRYLPYMSLLALAASAAGCAAPVDGADEATATAAQALTSGGVTASLTKVTQSGSVYTATITLVNQGKEPINNWQIGIGFNTGSFNGTWAGTGVTYVAGVPVFTAPYYASTLAAGASYSFTFTGKAAGDNYWPSVTSVDGVAPGTVNAGNPADGIDVISRAAATAAINVGRQYEIYKLPNLNYDPNFHIDSNLIWDSHAYRLAAGNQTIEFDPNVPGYAYIPNQAKAALAFAQLDRTVAWYLTTGLADCFGQVNSANVYAFKTGVLSIDFPGGGSGYLTNTGDHWTTTTSSANGTMHLNVTMTSTTDSWFGILAYSPMTEFTSVNAAVNAKYNPSGQNASCSPYNGPGGANNPYLVMSLGNGSWIPARYLAAGTNCKSGCTATAVLDPVPYAEPGAYYDANSHLVGPQPNPFGIISTSLYADPSHADQWGSRVINGVQQWGTFSQAVTLFGETEYKYVQQM
jgi:hypothetical protein